MTALKWLTDRASQPITILSTGLNALANNAAVLSAAISNGTDLDLYVDLGLDVTWGSAPTADAPVEIWLARSLDAGSTYEDASATGPILPKNGYVGSFFPRAVTTQQIMCIPLIIVPPGDFKALLYNKSGQAFPATGTTLKGRFYKEQAA